MFRKRSASADAVGGGKGAFARSQPAPFLAPGTSRRQGTRLATSCPGPQPPTHCGPARPGNSSCNRAPPPCHRVCVCFDIVCVLTSSEDFLRRKVTNEEYRLLSRGLFRWKRSNGPPCSSLRALSRDRSMEGYKCCIAVSESYTLYIRF